MKTLILKSLLCITITIAISVLIPFTGRADLLIYKGMLTEKLFGANSQQRLSLKSIAVVDHDTGNFSLLSYGTLQGTRRLFTEQHTNSHIVIITGPGGKTASAIAKIPSACEAQENPGIEGIYLIGINGTLTANTNTPVSFPRILTEGGEALTRTPGSDLPLAIEEKFTLVFNQPQTISSNQTGETLDAAFARITSEIQSLGYSP